MPLNEEELNEFTELLGEEKRRLLDKAKHTLDNEIELSKDDLADEADLANAIMDQGMSLKLRGRERTLMDKIDKALSRIDNGSFGICAVCGDDIEVKRLKARPVTTMCFSCKEEQELKERHYRS